MQIDPPGRTLPGLTHHRVDLDGTSLHVVAAGDRGTPVLLVHGFPESWWAFHKLIPLLAARHRVFAVDLRGFGDSAPVAGDWGSDACAADLHRLVRHLGVGAMHVAGQDVSGAAVFRLACTHPEDVLSFTAIEMGLPGFGLEALADVTRGGSWHIGMLAAPGIPELLLAGRERAWLGDFVFPGLCATPGAITPADVAEFARGYARPDGWRGAINLYRALLREGAELQALARARPPAMPALAVGAGGGRFTLDTLVQAGAAAPRSVLLEGVGHYAAMEAPAAVAAALLAFFEHVDASPGRA